jgi:anti-sigma regulatory factor (Ser/Thr protein kinase)
VAADSPAHHEPPGAGGPPGGSLILDQPFDSGSLYALRSAVGAHAAEAGLSPPRVYDVVIAAHELAANAVRHGAGRGRLRLHSDGPLLYCQVSDDGPASGNGKPGPAPGTPPWPSQHGHGLWLIAQVADWLSVDHGPAGTTATARFTSPPPAPARDGATARQDQGRPQAGS